MTVLSQNLQQAVDALEAERADAQRRIDWLDARLADLRQPDEPGEPEPSQPTTVMRRAARNGRSSNGNGMSGPVIAFLQDHPNSTAGEVAAELGLKRNSVSTLLTKLKANGDLVKGDRGYSAA